MNELLAFLLGVVVVTSGVYIWLTLRRFKRVQRMLTALISRGESNDSSLSAHDRRLEAQSIRMGNIDAALTTITDELNRTAEPEPTSEDPAGYAMARTSGYASRRDWVRRGEVEGENIYEKDTEQKSRTVWDRLREDVLEV